MPEDPGPLISVFTVATALSAAEHTDMTGITDDQTRVKHIFRFTDLAPRAVILDVEMARAPIPVNVLGVRALDHAVESMLAAGTCRSGTPSPPGDCDAAPEPAAQHADPGRPRARGACLEAAWLSIYGILSTGAGLSHAIGHQLAPQFGVMHGVSSAIMLPVAMEFNAPVTCEQLGQVAAAIRIPEDDPADDAPRPALHRNLAGANHHLRHRRQPRRHSRDGRRDHRRPHLPGHPQARYRTRHHRAP
jgi:alcohol dehydrogenase